MALGAPHDGWLPVAVPGRFEPAWAIEDDVAAVPPTPPADHADVLDVGRPAARRALHLGRRLRVRRGLFGPGAPGLAPLRGDAAPRRARPGHRDRAVPLGQERPGDLYFFARPGPADPPRRLRRRAAGRRRRADAARLRRTGPGRPGASCRPSATATLVAAHRVAAEPLSGRRSALSCAGTPFGSRRGRREHARRSPPAAWRAGGDLSRLSTVVTSSVPRMTPSDSQIGISGAQRHRLAAVDERHVVLVQRLEDQLDADEAEHQRQPDGQVDAAGRAGRRAGSTAGAGPSARTRWR